MSAKRLSLLSIALVILILLPAVIRNPYYMHLIIMMGVNTILAMTFLMLLNTGLLTIGAAGFWGIGAYASTLLVMELGLSFWIALPLSGAISGIIALGIGAIMVRMAGIVFAILTMVVNMIVVQVVGHITLFGGWGGIIGIPAPNPIHIPLLSPVEFVTKIPYYYLILFLLLLTVITFYALYRSRIGRNWRAIKQTPNLAEAVGIDLFRYRLLAFVIASAFAALAGSFYAHYFQAIEPDTFSVFKSIYIQLHAVLGGIDFLIFGPVTGSVVWTAVPELLSDLQELVPLISGIILVLLVTFLRGGLLSLPQELTSWIRSISKLVGVNRLFILF
jgi:branched-chain amino acid transport system permease protein